MNREPHVYATARQEFEHFLQLVLRLRDSHSIARNDDYIARRIQDLRGFFRAGGMHGLGFAGGRRADLQLSEGSEQDVGERPVHRAAHDNGQNESGRAVQRARHNQQLVVQHESHRGRRQSRVGIQQRDDGGHVRPADRYDKQKLPD